MRPAQGLGGPHWPVCEAATYEGPVGPWVPCRACWTPAPGPTRACEMGFHVFIGHMSKVHKVNRSC